ncbi:MAG: hypothetical protein ACE5F9_11650 [Phycisphaerae bacterium]
MDINVPSLEFSASLQEFLNALFGFVNGLLNTIFTMLAAFFNGIDFSTLTISVS